METNENICVGKSSENNRRKTRKLKAGLLVTLAAATGLIGFTIGRNFQRGGLLGYAHVGYLSFSTEGEAVILNSHLKELKPEPSNIFQVPISQYRSCGLIADLSGDNQYSGKNHEFRKLRLDSSYFEPDYYEPIMIKGGLPQFMREIDDMKIGEEAYTYPNALFPTSDPNKFLLDSHFVLKDDPADRDENSLRIKRTGQGNFVVYLKEMYLDDVLRGHQPYGFDTRLLNYSVDYWKERPSLIRLGSGEVIGKPKFLGRDIKVDR